MTDSFTAYRPTWSQRHLMGFWADARIAPESSVVNRILPVPVATTHAEALRIAAWLRSKCDALRSTYNTRTGLITVDPAGRCPPIESVVVNAAVGEGRPFFRSRRSLGARPASLAIAEGTHGFSIWLCASHLFIDGRACAAMEAELADSDRHPGCHDRLLHGRQLHDIEQTDELRAVSNRSIERLRSLSALSDTPSSVDPDRAAVAVTSVMSHGNQKLTWDQPLTSREVDAVRLAVQVASSIGRHEDGRSRIELLSRVPLPGYPGAGLCSNATFPAYLDADPDAPDSALQSSILRAKAAAYTDPDDPRLRSWVRRSSPSCMVNVHEIPDDFDGGRLPTFGPEVDAMPIPARTTVWVDVAVMRSSRRVRLSVAARRVSRIDLRDAVSAALGGDTLDSEG